MSKNTLTYREREIIKLLHGIDHEYWYTRKEVAEIFQITSKEVRKIEIRAIHKLYKQSYSYLVN